MWSEEKYDNRTLRKGGVYFSKNHFYGEFERFSPMWQKVKTGGQTHRRPISTNKDKKLTQTNDGRFWTSNTILEVPIHATFWFVVPHTSIPGDVTVNWDLSTSFDEFY